MNKLKLVVATALAGSAIAAGGLATAPPASAKPNRSQCAAMINQATFYGKLSATLDNLGFHDLAGQYYMAQSNATMLARNEGCFPDEPGIR